MTLNADLSRLAKPNPTHIMTRLEAQPVRVKSVSVRTQETGFKTIRNWFIIQCKHDNGRWKDTIHLKPLIYTKSHDNNPISTAHKLIKSLNTGKTHYKQMFPNTTMLCSCCTCDTWPAGQLASRSIPKNSSVPNATHQAKATKPLCKRCSIEAAIHWWTHFIFVC